MSFLLGGCSQTEGWEHSIGQNDPDALGPVSPILAPERVRRGTQFSIVVNTLGSSTCSEAEGAEVRLHSLVAEVTPYVRQAPEGSACSDDLAVQSREVPLRFSQTGTATIRVIGRPFRNVSQQ